MVTIPWSNFPKIDPLSLTDIFMRRVPSSSTKNQEVPFSDITDFIVGSSVKLVAKASDLPSLFDGFRTVEQSKSYLFTEPFTLSDPILFPAGWNGRILNSWASENRITYDGGIPMFNTLNVDGVITSITDAGGVAITIGTSDTHGLLDGQFVNLAGTTSYNQNRLVISNLITNFSFDVQLAYVGDETVGTFNTGFEAIQFIGFSAQSQGTANFMDVTSNQGQFSFITFNRFAEVGFLKPGIIRKAPDVITYNSIMAFITDGLELVDCLGSAFNTTRFVSLNPAVTNARGLIITGGLSKVHGTHNCRFTMTAAGQRPVRVDSSIISADEILFENSPDNLVADAFFDVTAGGLDETDPQVITDNNGIRKNSQTIGSAFVNGNTVETAIAAADTFQDIDFGTLTPSASIERFTLSNTTTSEFTYTGLKPINSPLSMSITIRKVGGATQVYNIKFVIDKGAGFVDFSDNIILPFEVKTTNASGTYECQAQLIKGDKIKPQISGIGTSDSIIADSMSINF